MTPVQLDHPPAQPYRASKTEKCESEQQTFGVTALPIDPIKQFRVHLPALVVCSTWVPRKLEHPTYT